MTPTQKAQYIKDHWDEMSISELAEAIGEEKYEVSYLAFQLRRNGFNLTNKRRISKVEWEKII